MYKDFVRGQRTAVHGSNQVCAGFWDDRWPNKWICKALTYGFYLSVIKEVALCLHVHVGKEPTKTLPHFAIIFLNTDTDYTTQVCCIDRAEGMNHSAKKRFHIRSH